MTRPAESPCPARMVRAGPSHVICMVWPDPPPVVPRSLPLPHLERLRRARAHKDLDRAHKSIASDDPVHAVGDDHHGLEHRQACDHQGQRHEERGANDPRHFGSLAPLKPAK